MRRSRFWAVFWRFSIFKKFFSYTYAIFDFWFNIYDVL